MNLVLGWVSLPRLPRTPSTSLADMMHPLVVSLTPLLPIAMRLNPLMLRGILRYFGGIDKVIEQVLSPRGEG
jgi:hypothetical protein